jgi:hypothetical protein
MCSHTNLDSLADGKYRCMDCGKYLKVGVYHQATKDSQGWSELEEINEFHDHLDMCEQCANHPFDLCKIGFDLIAKQARK